MLLIARMNMCNENKKDNFEENRLKTTTKNISSIKYEKNMKDN